MRQPGTHEERQAVVLRVQKALQPAHRIGHRSVRRRHDGNGRVGRLLITFLLCHAGVLRDPLLYLSLYFNEMNSCAT